MTKIGLRANIPNKLFHIPSGIAAKELALDAMAKEASAMFEKTFSTWKNKPTISIRATSNTRQIKVIGKIYEYVDKGTRPHIITPKRARFLSFRGGYKAKTSPGVITSRSGGASGKRVFAKLVHHPGSEARDFSVIIQERVQKRFVIIMKRVLKAYTSGEAPGI